MIVFENVAGDNPVSSANANFGFVILIVAVQGEDPAVNLTVVS